MTCHARRKPALLILNMLPILHVWIFVKSLDYIISTRILMTDNSYHINPVLYLSLSRF